MKIEVIKDEVGYQTAIRRIHELIQSSPNALEQGSKAGDEMELLSVLVEKYERDNYPVDAPDPIEAIRFRMEQMDLKQKDDLLRNPSIRNYLGRLGRDKLVV